MKYAQQLITQFLNPQQNSLAMRVQKSTKYTPPQLALGQESDLLPPNRSLNAVEHIFATYCRFHDE